MLLPIPTVTLIRFNGFVPANDDAIRSVQLITAKISESLIEGRMEFDKQLSEGMVQPPEVVEVAEVEAPVSEITPEEFVEKEFQVTDTELSAEAVSEDILGIDDMLKETNIDDEFDKI